LQIIKGSSSYLIFRLCPNLRKRYSQGHFWNGGYFCCSIGSNYEAVFEYIKNQECCTTLFIEDEGTPFPKGHGGCHALY